MKAKSLLLLRISMGLLLILWGLDKLVNVEHAVRVSETFYLGILTGPALWSILGVLEVLLGLAVVAGLWRRYAYPALLIVTGASLLGVWRSIIDPWGWYLEGTNVLFFPSLIIFAAALVLLAFRDEDELSADARRATAHRAAV